VNREAKEPKPFFVAMSLTRSPNTTYSEQERNSRFCSVSVTLNNKSIHISHHLWINFYLRFVTVFRFPELVHAHWPIYVRYKINHLPYCSPCYKLNNFLIPEFLLPVPWEWFGIQLNFQRIKGKGSFPGWYHNHFIQQSTSSPPISVHQNQPHISLRWNT